MDKYVLVPSDQYRAVTRAGEVGKHSITSVPPPGLPKSDSLAIKGVKVTSDEAGDINNQLKKLQKLSHHTSATAQSSDVISESEEEEEEGEKLQSLSKNAVSDNWEDWKASWVSI